MNVNKTDFTQRNVAIDILRALTMVLMIFVNHFWYVTGVPQWMLHAKRGVDFLGLADVVFPCFLFVVGMSIPFAIEQRFGKGLSELSTVKHILTRTFALFIMGIFTMSTEWGMASDVYMSMAVFKVFMIAAFFMIWNIYPKTEKSVRHLYTALKVVGVLILIYLAYIFRDARSEGYMRAGWWGILGAIGWAYLLCAFIYLFIRGNITKLFFLWLGFVALCMAKSSGLFPKEPSNIVYDLLNVLRIESGAHIALTLGGILFSLVITKYSHVAVRKKVIYTCAAIVALLVAGKISNEFWIISKNGATPPWVFYCSAIAIGAYSLLQWAVSKGKESWFNIIKPAGTATLTCYLVPYFMHSIFAFMTFFSLPEWMKDGMYGLIICTCFAFLCLGVTTVLERFRIKLKI